jgi:hypothetical protein
MALPAIADTREASSFEGTIKRRSGGPKFKPIDLGELVKLCAIHAAIMEIASWFRVGHAMIERRIAEQTLHDTTAKNSRSSRSERGYARGRISLRRKQNAIS